VVHAYLLFPYLPTGLDSLLTRDITQSSAMQRAGRAGREVICFVIDGFFTSDDPPG